MYFFSTWNIIGKALYFVMLPSFQDKNENI